MNHPGHEIVKCPHCGAIVSQCRCAASDKSVRYVWCGKCQQTPGEDAVVSHGQHIVANPAHATEAPEQRVSKAVEERQAALVRQLCEEYADEHGVIALNLATYLHKAIDASQPVPLSKDQCNALIVAVESAVRGVRGWDDGFMTDAIARAVDKWNASQPASATENSESAQEWKPWTYDENGIIYADGGAVNSAPEICDAHNATLHNSDTKNVQ